MNILIINGDNPIIDYIRDNGLGFENKLYYIDEPTEMSSEEMQKLLSVVKENNIDFIFSIGFIPVLSLACGALSIKYISWIIEGYNPVNYDYSIKNPWNEVYVADSFLYKEYKKLQISNVHFLPLYPTVSAVKCSEKTTVNNRFLVWTDLPEKIGFSFTSDDNLKDLSKGYIVGMSISRTHNLVNESLYEGFADYAKKDIEEVFSYEVNSLETKSHYYDYNLLYPKIQKQLSFPYLCRLRNEWDNYGEIQVVTDKQSDVFEEGIDVINKEKATPELVAQYDIVIFLPELNNNGLITIDMWNAMAMGKFVMCSKRVDFEVFGEDKPFTFKNTRELENGLRYFRANRNIRMEMSKRTQKKALEFGMLKDRIRTIFQ